MKRAALVALLFSCSGTALRPTADPGPAQRTARKGETVMFDGSKSTGTITKYTWDFGDGSAPGDGAMVSHVFQNDGDFTVTLSVRGPGGLHSATVLVNVGAGCTATAMISVQTSDPQPNVAVLFGSSGSMGCMGAALTDYTWDFGDNQIVDGGTAKASVVHTYADAGVYLVSLTVVDADLHSGHASRSLGVGVAVTGNPMLACQMSATGIINRPIQMTASASDPSGQALTYAWSFSDGASATGNSVSHAFTSSGSFTASVVATATDGRMSNTCVTNITVTSPPNYTGTWILNPTGSNFSGNCPFSVGFPTASVSIFHDMATDGGLDVLTVTPNGGNYPAGNELRGPEDMPASFPLVRMTPNENGGGSCAMSLTTEHHVRFTFSSATQVLGSWTKIYNAGQTMCSCVAGGSTNGAFTGFKM
jgi:PKD repeat protein